MSDIESITSRIDPPTVAEDIENRATQRLILGNYFRAHPLEDVNPDALEKLVGPNYRSRIAELRIEEQMVIANIPRWMELSSGKKKRLSGGYRFTPYNPLGPSAEAERPRDGLLFNVHPR